MNFRRQQAALYLIERAGVGATNSEIAAATGIPRTKIYQVTQALLAAGEVRGTRRGLVWHFIWKGRTLRTSG